MEFFISPIFYYVYSGLLLTAFFYLIIKVLKPYRNAHLDSNVVVEKLKDIVKNTTSISSRVQGFDHFINQDTNSSYIKNCVQPAWDYFRGKYNHSQQKNQDFVPDVYDFFLEEQFVQKYGKRKFVEAVPGMFLAAGIFGTFLSIAVGISMLDIKGDANTLKEGIALLLEGMQGKFISSLVGIALSISWQVIDKVFRYPLLSESFRNLRQQLDHAFPTQEESAVLYQLLKNEETRFYENRDFIRNEIIPELSKGFEKTLQNSLVPAIEQIKINILDIQKQGVSYLINQFINSLNQMSGDHMKQLGESVEKAIQWQERVHHEVELLVNSIQDSAENQLKISEKNKVISENVVQYADRLEQMVIQFSDVTGKMNTYQSEVANLLDKLTQERDLFHEFYDKHMFNLQSDIDTIQHLTKHQVEYQNKLEENLQLMESLSNSQLVLSKSLTDQAENAQSMTKELNKTVFMMQNHGSMFTRLQSQIKDQFEILSNDRQKHDELYEQLLVKMTEQSANMDKHVKKLEHIWDSTSITLSTSMNKFVSDMNQGLTMAFKQMDEELAKSVGYLTESTSAIQYGVSDLPNIMKDLKGSLDEINRRAVG